MSKWFKWLKQIEPGVWELLIPNLIIIIVGLLLIILIY